MYTDGSWSDPGTHNLPLKASFSTDPSLSAAYLCCAVQGHRGVEAGPGLEETSVAAGIEPQFSNT